MTTMKHEKIHVHVYSSMSHLNPIFDHTLHHIPGVHSGFGLAWVFVEVFRPHLFM
jgi:hypothetical protein